MKICIQIVLYLNILKFNFFGMVNAYDHLPGFNYLSMKNTYILFKVMCLQGLPYLNFVKQFLFKF